MVFYLFCCQPIEYKIRSIFKKISIIPGKALHFLPRYVHWCWTYLTGNVVCSMISLIFYFSAELSCLLFCMRINGNCRHILRRAAHCLSLLCCCIRFHNQLPWMACEWHKKNSCLKIHAWCTGLRFSKWAKLREKWEKKPQSRNNLQTVINLLFKYNLLFFSPVSVCLFLRLALTMVFDGE